MTTKYSDLKELKESVLRIATLCLLVSSIVFSANLSRAQDATAAKSSFAAPAVSTSTAKMQTDITQDASGKSWALEMGVERASNMIEASQPEADISTSFSVKGSYKFNKRFSAEVSSGLEKQEVGPKDLKGTDTTAALGIQGFVINDYLKTTHSIVGVAPTSNKSQTEDRLQGAIGLGSKLVATVPYGTYMYGISVRRNFHEFNLAVDGTPNIEYSLSNRLQTDTPIYGNFSISGDFVYKMARTYDDLDKQAFSFSIDLNYSFTDNFGVNLGTTNEGSALKANGQDSNIQLFNEQTSVLRLGLTYVL